MIHSNKYCDISPGTTVVAAYIIMIHSNKYCDISPGTTVVVAYIIMIHSNKYCDISPGTTVVVAYPAFAINLNIGHILSTGTRFSIDLKPFNIMQQHEKLAPVGCQVACKTVRFSQ